jgi:hypothetical protein
MQAKPPEVSHMHATSPIQGRQAPTNQCYTWTSHGSMSPPEHLNRLKNTCTLRTNLRTHRTATPRINFPRGALMGTRNTPRPGTFAAQYGPIRPKSMILAYINNTIFQTLTLFSFLSLPPQPQPAAPTHERRSHSHRSPPSRA